MRASLSRPVSLLALLVLFVATAVRAEDLTVRVLHTTDLHGMLTTEPGGPARGLDRVATRVAAARAEGPTLLLDAGDALAGSALVRAWREGPRTTPEPVIAALNALDYDALAIGNHDFDHGRAALDSARAQARFPFLAANVLDARTRQPAFGTSVVRVVGGARIGVLGLTTPAVPRLMDPALVEGLEFVDPIETARREIARLRGPERCAAVVVLFHSGLERDPSARGGDAKPKPGTVPNEDLGYRLAYEVPGIDLLVLGHTHAVVPAVTIGGALVTQAGQRGEAVGRAELRFTRASNLAEWTLAGREARVLAVSDTVSADPTVATLVAPYAAAADAMLDEVVAQASAPFAAPWGRFADHALLHLVHRCQLEVSGADVSLATTFDPALTIPPGPVRRRDLLRLYPYDNTLGVVELTGAELTEVLEHAAGMLAPYEWDGRSPLLRDGVAGYQFETAYGVEYAIDLTRPAGSRIVGLSWKGRPLASDQRLRVVANSYRLAGGGDYLPLRRATRVWSSTASMPELLYRWARAQGTLTPTNTSGWTLRPAHAAAPERALVDRLVRRGAASRAEVLDLVAEQPARRMDLLMGLARAFDLRAPRASGTWGDVPDSLQTWLDGAVARGGIGPLSRADRLAMQRETTLGEALEWSERTARAHGYALATRSPDAAFRRGLLTGVSGASTLRTDDRITRAQWLAMLSNLRFPTLRVLETTDFHGAILGGSRDRRSQRPTGGSAALAAAIERERAFNPEGTVLLDGGDIFQGTMISNLQYGRPVVEQMNALGYAAAAVGNHEFDWGVDTLVARVREMRFAALGANMVERRTGRVPRWARADTTVRRRGLNVGIVGLAYPNTPSVTLATHVAHLRFDDDSTTAANVAARLRNAGASVVVGVGHIPSETDSMRRARGDLLRLASAPGVDAWFGGHSHNVVNDRVEGRPVLIAGAQGQYLAIADLVVDPIARRVVESQQRIDLVYADVPVDSAWTARVERWNSSVAPIAATVIGDAAVALHRRRPESTVGNLICDAMRADVGADIAMQNPGGMRADLDAGPVTRGDVYAMMPFDNTIVVLELTGELVKLALEQSLAGDRITQVGGLRYEFDPARTALERIVTITLADGSALDPARTYRVAVNNFMATGGDRYDALTKASKREDTGRLIRTAMESWVRERCAGGRSFEGRGDGRIRSLGRGD